MAMQDLLIRQMPHSLEGEQAVLGSMLIDERCVKDVMDELRPDDFYLRQNREIFETIYSMFTYARPIDGITVCEEMQKAGTYDENTTRSYDDNGILVLLLLVLDRYLLFKLSDVL